MFLLEPNSGIPSNTPYQHCAIALAEGFQKLNIPFFSNINYWFDLEQNEFLFKANIQNVETDIYIYSAEYILKNNNTWQKGILQNSINILLDTGDWLGMTKNPVYSNTFDLILRCHYHKELLKNKKYVPWAFGLTNRIISELEKSQNCLLDRSIYISYRVSQNLRQLSELMVPVLNKKYQINYLITDSLEQKTNNELSANHYWNQTGRRHNIAYYQKLNSTLMSFAFGGILEYKNPSILYKVKEKVEKSIGIRKFNNFDLYQFDSWRLWESMASNSCTVMLDLKNWNLNLPILPDNYVHYIGIKNLDFETASNKILALPESEITEISRKGQKWVHKYYSPKAVAARLLELVIKISK